MYRTHSQWISQFYLHTRRTSINSMNHTCLCLPSRSWYSFTDPRGIEGWVGLGLVLGIETECCEVCCDSGLHYRMMIIVICSNNQSVYPRRKLSLSGCTPGSEESCSTARIQAVSVSRQSSVDEGSHEIVFWHAGVPQYRISQYITTNCRILLHLCDSGCAVICE